MAIAKKQKEGRRRKMNRVKIKEPPKKTPKPCN
jgi:hypothetical protein